MYYLKLHIRSLISHWAKIKVSAGLHYFEALKWEPNPCLFCLSSAILTSFNDFNQPVAQNWDLWVRLPEHYHSLHSSQFPLLIECRVTFYSTDQIVSVTCFKYINDFSHNWNKSQIPSVIYKALLLLCPHVAILSPGSQSSIALIFFFFFFYLQTFQTYPKLYTGNWLCSQCSSLDFPMARSSQMSWTRSQHVFSR